MDPKNIY